MTTTIETTEKGPSWPTLFKRTTGDKTQSWHIAVVPNDDGTADIVTTFGLVDGKLQQQRETISAGKNVGRRNATTPLGQAILEGGAAWKRHRERHHYGLDPEANESAAKRAVAPMLAHKYADHAKKVDWKDAYVQHKLDGHRVLAFVDKSGVRLVSRKGVEIKTLPHIARALFRVCAGREMVIDGEVYLHGVPVTDVGGWVKRAQPDTARLEYHIYDMVASWAFWGRQKYLTNLDWPGRNRAFNPLVLVPTTRVIDEAELFALRDEFVAQGYEGAMLRWGDFGYEAGKRSQALLKAKLGEDAEFTVVGFREGRGTNAGMAVFRCVTDAGDTFEVTAPGTHDEKREHYRLGASRAGKPLTVKYAYLTKTDHPVPFHPVAVGFRDDA